jgi:hypothetical protein
MQKFKPVFIEVVWILVILNITVLISIFVFNWTFLGSNFDISLKDKYFTIASWKIILPLFIFLTFITFVVKEIRYGYTRKIPNIFLLCAGFILIILITTINKQIILSEITMFGGWTATPPLSALTETHIQATLHPGIHVASNLLTVGQIIVTLCLMYVAFRMGTNYYTNQLNGVSNKQPKVPQPAVVKPVKQEKVEIKNEK